MFSGIKAKKKCTFQYEWREKAEIKTRSSRSVLHKKGNHTQLCK